MSNGSMDPEKGPVPTTVRAISTSTSIGAQSENHSLELFQVLVGIHTPAFLTRGKDKQFSIYQNAKIAARSARIQYTVTSIIANSLYMLQILFAAIFTGLSAYKKTTSVTLTTLGAVNTVIAGALAWQKGQGVPMRYRKARDSFEDVVLEIEMAERSFADLTGAPNLDPRAEALRIQHLYEAARQEEQANHPDLYVSTVGKMMQGDGGKQQAGDSTSTVQAQAQK